MQLYEVWFQLHFSNVVDIGRAIVCASDQANAKEIVIATLDLPVSALTQCEAKRLKPNIFLLERKEVSKPLINAQPQTLYDHHPTQKGLRAVANTLADNREYRREMTAYIAQQQWAMDTYGQSDEAYFECRILATVIADCDRTALWRLASALKERGKYGNVDTSRHVRKIWVDLVPDYGQAAVAQKD